MSPRSPAPNAADLRQKALRLLATREHSHAELLRKLEQSRARQARGDVEHAATSDEIARIVHELAQAGWQSDARYAEALVRRLAGRASRRYIENKLAEAGISREVAQAALAEFEQDDATAARTLWQRRFGVPPRDEKDRRRQIRFLLSRGFHLSDAFRIVPAASVATGMTVDETAAPDDHPSAHD
ncbi:MAG: regulatory protein RecX [Casimicrobiaceae bacterium]